MTTQKTRIAWAGSALLAVLGLLWALGRQQHQWQQQQQYALQQQAMWQ